MKYTHVALLSLFCFSFITCIRGIDGHHLSPSGMKSFTSFIYDDLPPVHTVVFYSALFECMSELGLGRADLRTFGLTAGLCITGMAARSFFQAREFMPTSSMQPLDPVKYKSIHEIVEKLSQRAHIIKPTVWRDSQSTQQHREGCDFRALVAGLRPGLVLSEDMINRFTSDELEAVIGHEIAHIASYDIHRAIALQSIPKGIYLYYIFVMAQFATGCINREWRRYILFNQIMLEYGLPLMFMCTLVFVRAYSRYCELRADRLGAELTYKPGAMIRALKKIAASNGSTCESTDWSILRIFDTHPRMGVRLEQLRALCLQLKQTLLDGSKELLPCQSNT